MKSCEHTNNTILKSYGLFEIIRNFKVIRNHMKPHVCFEIHVKILKKTHKNSFNIIGDHTKAYELKINHILIIRHHTKS